MARPTKLTPEVADGIIRLIEQAVHPEIAAAAHGVAQDTYREWLARGRGTDPLRPAEPIYIEFAGRVVEAENRAEAALVALAVAKARSTADALAILERRYGDRWRERRDIVLVVRNEVERLAANPEEAAAAMAEVDRILAGSHSG